MCQTRNVSMSVEPQQATVTTGTSHQVEEYIKRNISVSVGIQQAAAIMGTFHGGAAACQTRNVSVSFELQQAAVTLMETVGPAEVCAKRSTTKDEARDHLIQHFSQGSGVSHIQLFFKQIERHGRWMHSCHVQLKFVDRDHNLMTPLCAGCLLIACSMGGVGVIAWVGGGRECAAELSLPKTSICVRTSVHNFIPFNSLPVIHFQMLCAVLHLRWCPIRDGAVVSINSAQHSTVRVL